MSLRKIFGSDLLGKRNKKKKKGNQATESHGQPSDADQSTNEGDQIQSSKCDPIDEGDPQRTKAQRIRDGAIILLDFGSIIAESSDLLKPMKVVCGFIKKVLETAKSIDQVNEEWKELTRRLKFHMATIANHTIKLEEDQHIDRTPPPLDPAIVKALKDYASELNKVHQLLYDSEPSEASLVVKAIDVESNKGQILHRTRDMDEAFQRYTVALQQFVASTVDQMQQELAQFHQGFKEGAEATHLHRLRGSNDYGNQHVTCLQGTREKTLDTIRQWADDSTGKPMFCLLDVAGSGKSTVAKHMVEEWRGQNRLLARFFFSRDTTETMSTNLFCSTVVDALSVNDDFKGQMEKFKKKRPDWHHLSFEDQFEGLVAEPLRILNLSAILTVDALDECDNSYGCRDQLLNTLQIQQSSTPLLRILVTGRPESGIKHWAEKAAVGYTNFHQLEGDSKDVETYITSRLQHLPSIGARVYQVISNAEGLFIWARIACDLLTKTTDIDGLLETLRGNVKLDHLYRVALEQSIPKDNASHRATLMVLQMILAARTPLSIEKMEKLSPKPGIVEPTIDHLGSLLLYRGREDPIRLLHVTVREFLTERQKANVYYIQPELGHHLLALGCLNFLDCQFKLIQEGLKIGRLDMTSQRKVDSFDKTFTNISPQGSRILFRLVDTSLYNVIQEVGSEREDSRVCNQ